jgi:hypothetical protein
MKAGVLKYTHTEGTFCWSEVFCVPKIIALTIEAVSTSETSVNLSQSLFRNGRRVLPS